MKPGDTQDGTVTFMATVGFAILDLNPHDRQEFLNHLARHVKRVTRDQYQAGQVSETECETVLRLHQILLEWLHAVGGKHP